MDHGEMYKTKARNTSRMLLKYFDYVMDNTPPQEREERQEELLRMLKKFRREFEKEVSKYVFNESAQACPDGYKQCRDGVCVPIEEGCDDWMGT